MRNRIFSAVVCCLAAAAAARAEDEPARVQFAIEKQPLVQALNEFSRQSGMVVLFDNKGVPVNAMVAPSVAGTLSREEALQRILAGTDLTYKFANANTVQISPASARPTSSTTSSDVPAVRVARLDQAAPVTARTASTQPAASAQSDATIETIEQIVVTAQKRIERLADVPVPVTVLDGATLLETNQLRLQDYYARVPGLNFSMDNRGAPAMAIRGVTTGAFVSPTTGVTIDDVPFGSTVIVSSFSPAPDVDANEVARVEVLRGPQGTLYGASSIGGLIKYVTVEPSVERVGGHLQTGVNSTRNSDGVGYSFSGAVNVPLSNTLAVRASGFSRQDQGYIDNVVTGEDGVNDLTVQGGRVSALWTPSDTVSLKLSALLQRSELDASAQVDGNLGDLEHAFLRGIGGYDRKVQAYSANFTAQLGAVEFTSLTGYGRSTSSDSYDVSSRLGFAAQLSYGVGGIAWTDQGNETTKFSQEFRFSTELGDRVAWRFGLFYTDERSKPNGGYVLIDPVTYARGAQILDQRIRATYEEYAAFTDVTLQLTDRFDVQVGGRYSRNEQTNATTSTGTPPLFADVIQPEADSDDDSLTYLLTPRFKITPDFMVYARLASGYRPGGPNVAAYVGGLPDSFGPDKTQNFEIGSKGSFLERRLTVDASLYYIRWRDIQLGQIDSAFNTYTDNGGRARSRGVELSIEARPLTGLSLSTWAVYSEAELTEAAPPTSTALTAEGDRLPYSSRVSANFSVEQSFSVANDVTAFVGGTLIYVGDREGEFASIFSGTPQRQRYPSYTQVDLNTGVRYRDWLGNVYVNNLTDKRGVLGGGLGVIPDFAFNYFLPRTIGLSVSRTF